MTIVQCSRYENGFRGQTWRGGGISEQNDYFLNYVHRLPFLKSEVRVRICFLTPMKVTSENSDVFFVVVIVKIVMGLSTPCTSMEGVKFFC